MNPIQSATLEDIPELCALLAILFEQEADFQPDAEKQAVALREIITHPSTGQILVFREGNEIAGMVNLLFTISTACGGKVAILEDMIVRPSRRGDGLGSQLLQAAISLAHREGCMRVTLLTDRVNDAAIRFYLKQGFGVSEMITLRKRLV